MPRSLALSMILVAASACSGDRGPPDDAGPTKGAAPANPPATAPTPLVDLDDSLEAVRAEFNAHADEHRFLTLLSPT
jgi:hypothetical protein